MASAVLLERRQPPSVSQRRRPSRKKRAPAHPLLGLYWLRLPWDCLAAEYTSIIFTEKMSAGAGRSGNSRLARQHACPPGPERPARLVIVLLKGMTLVVSMPPLLCRLQDPPRQALDTAELPVRPAYIEELKKLLRLLPLICRAQGLTLSQRKWMPLRKKTIRGKEKPLQLRQLSLRETKYPMKIHGMRPNRNSMM